MDTLHTRESPKPPRDEIIATIRALEHQVEKPLGGDRRSAAFAKAMLYLLDGESYAEDMGVQSPHIESYFGETTLTTILEEVIDTRAKRAGEGKESFAPSPFIGLLMRIIQADRLEHETLDRDLHYPHDYVRPDAWLITIKNIMANPERAEQFFLRAYTGNLLSNIPQRGAALELGARALQASGALGENPVIYHVGCSQQLIEAKIAYKDLYPYRPIEVIENDEPSSSLTHKLNQKLAERWLTRLQIGFDLNDKNDPKIAALAKACSFYPSELLNYTRVTEYDALSKLTSPDVRFVHGDFLDYATPQDIARKLGMHTVPPADITFFSFSLYQQTQQQQMAMLQHAKQLSPNGWTFVLDFVRPDTKSPTGMQFEKDWSASSYLCRLLGINHRDPGATPQELFVFENGRIERVQAGMGVIAVANTATVEANANRVAAQPQSPHTAS